MKRILLFLAILAALSSGCALKDLPFGSAIPVAIPGSPPHATPLHWYPATKKLIAWGNLNANKPRLGLCLQGNIAPDAIPDATYLPFKDLFGFPHTLKVTFSRLDNDPNRLDMNLSPVKDRSDVPDPDVIVNTAPSRSIRFNPEGACIAPSPADFTITIQRPLTAEEKATGLITMRSYSMDFPVDAWKLENMLGTSSFQVKVQPDDRENPLGNLHYLVFAGRFFDSNGAMRTINLKAVHSAPDTWLFCPLFELFPVEQADYKIGDRYFPCFSHAEPDRLPYWAGVRFELNTGRVVSGGNQGYRLHLNGAEPLEFTFDLSRLTCISGETYLHLAPPI